jgi:1,2-diacylglycerol 3-alpha-glucosyltransferase
MRIALLTQSYPPMISGAALVVQRLAEGLAKRGHAVLVLAASDKGVAYVQTSGSLTVARLKAWPNPLRRGQHFLAWPERAIGDELARFQPQVVHAHDPLVISLAGLRAAKALKKRVPWMLTSHQLPWFVSLMAPRLLRRPIEASLWAYGRWLYPKFEALITPSQMIAEVIEGHGSKRPIVISNGVDTERFTPEPSSSGEAVALRRKYGLDPQLPIILYTGRLDVDKRVELVVQAVAKVGAMIPVQLLVVGDGKERERLIGLSERLGVSGASHFIGMVPSTGDLPELYRIASVFITASEIEIQSSVVLEAAASGLPVVAMRASSMPEFIEEGVSGYLVPPEATAEVVEGFAERLARIVGSPEKARVMGRVGRRLAERHSQTKTLEAHEQLYEMLMAQQGD